MIDDPQLSERMRQILDMAALGLTDKNIALELGVGIGTLRTYWDRLRQRLDARSRTEALAKLHQYRFDHLKTQNEELLQILSGLSQLIWTAKPSGQVDYCNDWFALYGGMPLETYLGPGCRALMPVEEHQDSAARWKRAQETGEPYEANVHFLHGGDGVARPHRIRIFPLCNRTGEVYKWVGCGHEIQLAGSWNL